MKSPLLKTARIFADAKRYLYRNGVNPDTTIDPVDLIQQLTGELAKKLSPDERATADRMIEAT